MKQKSQLIKNFEKKVLESVMSEFRDNYKEIIDEIEMTNKRYISIEDEQVYIIDKIIEKLQTLKK